MTPLNPDLDDIQAYHAIQSEMVRKHAVIVDADLCKQDYMLHIDKNHIPVFTPMMPRSAALSEDNTAPRVTVSPNLVGCYLGYNRGHDDFAKGTVPVAGEKDPFRGGYVIHKLAFKHCFMVNQNLVPDALRTGEHWLVPYNQDSLTYPSVVVGKMFVSQISYGAVAGQTPSSQVTFYVEVSDPQGFAFSPTKHLSQGFHKVVVFWTEDGKRDHKKDETFEVVEITPEQYAAAKSFSASMLAFKEKTAEQKRAMWTGW